jgi:hypothetical protein
MVYGERPRSCSWITYSLVAVILDSDSTGGGHVEARGPVVLSRFFGVPGDGPRQSFNLVG